MTPRWLLHLLQTRALWEGRYVDLWSVPHLISGALIAHVLLGAGFSFWSALGLSISIAILWEFFELFTRLSSVEHFSNSITDILFAQVGFILFFCVRLALPEFTHAATFWVLAILFILTVVLGWISYSYYSRSKKQPI